MQFEAIRTISTVDTIKNVTPDTGAEEMKQKYLLTNLLRFAEEQSKGVVRKAENLIQRFVNCHKNVKRPLPGRRVLQTLIFNR